MKESDDQTGEVLDLESLKDLLIAPESGTLEKFLIPFLPSQRWFGSKTRPIRSIKVLDYAQLAGLETAILFLEVAFDGEGKENYQLALSVSRAEKAEQIRSERPGSMIAEVKVAGGQAVLHDAVVDEEFRQVLLRTIQINGELRTQAGALQGRNSSAFVKMGEGNARPSRVGSAEQSNTSIIYGGSLILKLFRRLQTGENPDTEIGRFLTDVAHFPRIAPFLGDITLSSEDGEATTIAMLQGLVANEGDGWQWTMQELARFYETVAKLSEAPQAASGSSFLNDEAPSASIREHAGNYLRAAELLGTRTAEMHLALATPTGDPAFAKEPFSASELSSDARRIESQLSTALDALQQSRPKLTEINSRSAEFLLSQRVELLSRATAIGRASATDFGQCTRIHGDYHLGQILRTQEDFVVLDFEGEPARSLAERRAKQSPLKDVAGMLRSFGYAAYGALFAFSQHEPDARKNLEPWAIAWQNAVSAAFLRAYRRSVEEARGDILPRAAEAQLLLNAYLIEKALYELQYELNNRPTWVGIPLAGIVAILD